MDRDEQVRRRMRDTYEAVEEKTMRILTIILTAALFAVLRQPRLRKRKSLRNDYAFRRVGDISHGCIVAEVSKRYMRR